MKVSIEAKCIKTEIAEQGSAATFVVLHDKQPQQKEGERRTLNARQVTQMTFQDDAAKQFRIGPATIIIEQPE